MNNMITCQSCQTHLPDLLLDDHFETAHPDIASHLKSCDLCAAELSELRSTFALMDAWTAPEPSPYFDQRLRARVREAAQAGPEGFFERLHAFLTFSTGRQLRPALTGVLMLLLLIGGGTFAGFYEHSNHSRQPAASATVNDLKILDNNAQALQQMDQLLDSGDDSADPQGT